MVTKTKVLKKLNEVLDPELGISLVDLGLIYNVRVKKGTVYITMTLTTIGCPLFDMIATEIQYVIKQIDGVSEVSIDLTFDPPWSPEKMSKEAKIQLGFF